MTLILCAIGAYLYFTSRFSFGSVRTQGRHVKAAGAVLMMPAVTSIILGAMLGILFAGNPNMLLSLISLLSFVELALLLLSSVIAYILIANPANAPRLPGILGQIQDERREHGDQPVRNRTVTIYPRGTTAPAPMQAQQKEFGRVLSTREAAEYMNVSEAEILSWIDSGKLAAARINYMYRIARSNLDELRTAPPTS